MDGFEPNLAQLQGSPSSLSATKCWWSVRPKGCKFWEPGVECCHLRLTSPVAVKKGLVLNIRRSIIVDEKMMTLQYRWTVVNRSSLRLKAYSAWRPLWITLSVWTEHWSNNDWLAKHEKILVSAAESLSSSHKWSFRVGLSWTIFFFKTESAYGTRRLNPLKCAYFDRLQAAVILINGLLSKYAKLIILFTLNKRTRGPICLNTV